MPSAAYWLREIDAARKREKEFRTQGRKILDIYEGEERCHFNILYSNTETLMPALYSAIPKPVVERRYKDDDPLGKAAAEAAKRGLEFLIDTNVEGYETFDEGIRASVLDALLPGRGVTSVEYSSDSMEMVCPKSRKWDRVYFGFATKWSDVPWVCYEHHVDKAEFKRVVGQLPQDLKFSESAEEAAREKDEHLSEEEKGQRMTTPLFVIWDKTEKKVVFLSPQVKRILKTEDDPLGLTGFFDCPKPLMFVEKNDLLPTPLYKLYETQAKELDRIQFRISKIVEAIKARGIYDSSLGTEIEKVLEEEDNALVASDKTASLAAESGLQNAIWFMPLQELVAALQQLYVARDSVKQVIFEIIGLADIMRGATNASETLGAQQIKQQWGSLRLKRLQKEVMRYVRDLLRMMLEIAVTKFDEQTWAKMTGLPYLTAEQAMLLQKQMMAAQMQAQVNPQAQQQVQQFEQQLQAPKWSDVLGLLKDDMQRAYRIDIETNSTLDPEAADEQRMMGELLNGVGQAMNGIGPMVENGTLPFDAAKGVLLMVARKYRFGSEIEEHFQKMTAPQKPDPAAAEKEKQAAEVQKEQAKAQADAAKAQSDAQVKQAELAKQAQVESAQAAADAQVEMKKLEEETIRFKEELAMKERISRAEIQAKKEMAKHECQMKNQAALDATREQIKGQKAMKMMEIGKVVDDSGEEVTEQSLLEMVQKLVADIVPTIEQAIHQSQATVQAQIDALAAEVRTVHPIEMLKGADGLTSHVKRGDKVIPIVRKRLQ